MKQATKTPFEQAIEKIQSGELKTPSVSTSKGSIDYIHYQLAVHKYQLSLLSKGIHSRGIKLKDFKNYYGLTGRTASDCLPQFLQIFDTYVVENL